MKSAVLSCLCLLALVDSVGGEAKKTNTSNAIRPLQGYVVEKSLGVDATSCTITNGKGTSIDFEIGPNEGFAANPDKTDTYAWFRTQVVRGKEVYVAMTKRGLKTVLDQKGEGNVLLVTFNLGERANRDYAANFETTIHNDQELADALLIALASDFSARQIC